MLVYQRVNYHLLLVKSQPTSVKSSQELEKCGSLKATIQAEHDKAGTGTGTMVMALLGNGGRY